MARDLSARLIIELLRAGERVSFSARGSSMWPAIPSHSRIEVEPCAAEELCVGEIGAFERDGSVVVHRVTRVASDGVWFQGDSLHGPDGAVEPARVLGRARVVQRRALSLRWPRRADAMRLWRALRSGLGLLLRSRRRPRSHSAPR